MADQTDLAGNNPLLNAILGHIASGGSINVQGPLPGTQNGPAAPGGGDPGMQVQMGPPPPPPPPMNFTDFATRPENGMKVQGALSTQPNQPTPFNHPPAPPLSVFNPSPNLLPLNTSSQATPPPFTPQQPADTAPPMPASVGAPTPAAPNLPAPAYNVQPGMYTPDEYFAAHPDVAAHPIAQTKWGKALLFLTSAAAGAAGGMHGDPLAGLNFARGIQEYNNSIPDINQARYEAGVVKPYQQILQNEDTRSQIAQRGASAALDDAKRQQIPQKAQRELAQHGLKQVQNEDGTTSTAVDPDSPVTKRMQAQADVAESQVQLHKSEQDLKEAQEENQRAQGNPNSPQYKLSVQKLAVAQAGHQAAMVRAQAAMGNYLMHSRNVDLQGNKLPGAPQIDDGSGNLTTVGTANAPTALKAQPKVAQFNDVGGALDNLERNAEKPTGNGGRLNSPAIVYALQHATGTPSQIMQSWDKAGLSPDERAYVQSVLAAHENVQALRQSAGGTATDSSVAKLDSLIPNGSTPDLDYLKGQTSQIRQTADRLSKGVVTVKGGATIKRQSPMSEPQGGNGGGSKPLTPQVAQQYLAKAGGDKNKARSLAKADGYTF